MFDKQIYWKNRKDNKRGQGENPKGKFYPKGEKIPYITTTEGEEAEYPNALGAHMVKIDKKFVYVNRTEARKREFSKDRTASHKNYAHQHEKNGFRHVVNKSEFKPAYPPSLTNHLRHRQRQIERMSQKETEAKNALQ